jgi:uncharacterized membrane protein YgdD (TMEM256/DUF423 family)
MTLVQQIFFICGTLFGMLGITAGAFGSHYLKNKFTPEDLSIFEVAVRYQMYHALALIALAAILGWMSSNWIVATGWCWIFGTLIFSASLYLLVFTGVRTWGAVTPIGGILLVAGWGLLVVAALFLRTS